MTRLLACPFCRELFDAAEAGRCPSCELALAPLADLPPSFEVLEEQAAQWERDSPEDQRRGWLNWGAGRGLLLAIALASLASFGFAPWVAISAPTSELRTGYALARGPLGWLWGGAAAWLVSSALVVSRRSLREMRGVRAILVVFAAMTATEVVLLACSSPRGSPSLHYVYEWRWGFYASLLLSCAGMLAALGFGRTPTSRAAARAGSNIPPASGPAGSATLATRDAASTAAPTLH
ncbi:MAG TPA: hypothetical protein VG963_01595 [Polyangiaceae bacterium]|nr:hypothetical protein [Polyangiaceae bacterium]